MVFASRGCPINCDFCSVSKLFGRTYRFKSVEEVVNEIKSFNGYYYLIDDTVFGRPSTYDFYLSLYEQIAKLTKIRYWTGQANLDAALHTKGRDVIRKAVKSGLVYVAIGMESINGEVLKKSGSFSKMGIKKDEDVIHKMKESIRFIQDQGILISGWFTIGYEEDDAETYYNTLDFCNEMNIMPVFSPVNALMGTDLYIRLKQESKLQNTANNITNVSHPSITNEQVLVALEYTLKKGYNLVTIMKRTYFYTRKFVRHSENSIHDVIHKTIFSFITQRRMRQIVRMEIDRLRKKIEQLN